MTESERRFHEVKIKRDMERAKKAASESHRQRVDVSCMPLHPVPVDLAGRILLVLFVRELLGMDKDENEKRLKRTAQPNSLPAIGSVLLWHRNMSERTSYYLL